MARLRPFRGLRHTLASGELASLVAPPTLFLTPAQREGYAVRSPYSAVGLAAPEGHGDDRSKFIRYARAAARLAEWRREGVLAAEASPAFYRLTQRFGTEPTVRTALLAVADTRDGVRLVEAGESKIREERLRLLEATRTAFEPSVAFYEDPSGGILGAVWSAPASSETSAGLDGLGTTLETINDPEAVATIAEAFRDTTLLVADNVEGFEAAAAFPGGGGAFVALASLDDPAHVRLAVHRVLRRLPGGLPGALARLGEVFEIEEHHNRNLVLHIDRLGGEGRAAFGMATEGGLGYLLVPRQPIQGSASAWLQREVFGPLLEFHESDPTLTFIDPVQAVRAADEGAAAAFILPTPSRTEIRDAARNGVTLPAHAAQSFPAVPTGLVYWSMGDDA